MSDHAAYPSDRHERAAQLVAEGRFGGRQPGAGRPRKIRPSELAAEAAREHWAAIEAALVAGVEQGTPVERARAAQQWVRLALGEGALEIRERGEDRLDEFSTLTAEEVHARFAREVVEMIRTGVLDTAVVLTELPQAIDAEVVESDAD